MDKYTNLRTMEQHLRHGQLSVERFNFSVVRYESPCDDSCGCAIGELPVLAPDRFFISTVLGQLFLKENKAAGVMMQPATPDVMAAHFGVSKDELFHLFIPQMQKPELYGGVHLSPRATRYEVADNIDAFIRKAQCID